MRPSDNIDISYILTELCNHLMLNGSMVFFSGLLYGKLGISLFFFHYSRYTGNPLYHEYALHLVELVKSQIHEDYPLDYERGLAGVGAGFDYLKKHEYFNVGDDLMNEIDVKIIKAVGYDRRVDMLTGFGRYLMSRHENTLNTTIKDALIQIKSYLPNSIDAPNENNKKDKIFEIINSFNLSDLDELFSNNHDFAFQGGYTGLGLALISTIDADSNSWTNLL